MVIILLRYKWLSLFLGFKKIKIKTFIQCFGKFNIYIFSLIKTLITHFKEILESLILHICFLKTYFQYYQMKSEFLKKDIILSNIWLLLKIYTPDKRWGKPYNYFFDTGAVLHYFIARKNLCKENQSIQQILEEK